ncbi:MAG TPA: HD-GYP domain-containing protein, partial [Acidimicrobiales bacterium]|nr:HD-GYP domain-containing protein [Acidimicrobiales bacterium]
MVTTNLDPLLPALQGAVAIYDRGTAQHSLRVSHTAAAMASSLGLSAEEVEAASWSGILHDIGKLGVAVDVLRKTGPLTEGEWREVRRHPCVGSDLVLAISAELGPIAQAIRSHHERWDGTGYPDGRRADEIPLLGRIIAIADAFDAITHRRPYRRSQLDAPEGLEELRRGAGSQFDSNLTER